jgi:hypothetical protein
MSLVRRSIGFVTLVVLSSLVYSADCSVGAGPVLNHSRSRTNAINLGCEFDRYDLRAYYVGPQDVTTEDALGPWREIALAYGALSAMRVWRFSVQDFEPQFGFGLFIKRDDRRHTWHGISGLYRTNELGEREYFTTHRANRYVPLPVSFSLSFGVRWDDWRVRYHHASNAGLYMPNDGQDMLQLEYVW